MLLFYANLAVLVTGGAGFIGSHLVEQLVECGARVTVLDNLSTGNLDNLKNVMHKITFIHGDITDKKVCLAATHEQDIIFHLAAFISVPDSIEMPEECHATNVDGTFNLLESARINKVKRFVFSSSAAVYGTRDGVCAETDHCHPESPYGFTKRIGELYCQQYAHNYGMHTVILRYFNVYGDRQNPDGAYAAVVAKFKKAMHENSPITIFGDGNQTRDFINVKDVACANLTLGMHAHACAGEIFNIGTGTSISLLELIAMLKKDFPQFNQGILFRPARAGDIKHSSALCTKYQAIQE